MLIEPTSIPEVRLITAPAYGDARGRLVVTWNAERYANAGITDGWVQDNLSVSARGVLRGLHLQEPGGQSKLVSVVHGEIYDVAVDVRRGSPTFGRWVGAVLSAADHRQLYIPAGFAHGFLVLSEIAAVAYKMGAPYRPETELTVRWDDPAIGIEWPLGDLTPTISAKDGAALPLAEIAPGRLPSVGSV